MELFHCCFAPGVAAYLICRKSALLLGQLLVALPDASFVAGTIVVCWGCPSLAMRDSSSVVECLRIPRGQKSESAVVLVGGCTCDPDIIRPEPDAGRKPNAINAGPEPDVGPKPDAINAGPEPDAGLSPMWGRSPMQ
ncbi:hypothetical protein CRG98_017706 [Punica granatum]|uniref:Uncharacterized protein n=1 Tax=Punica granatum TaxID=22663 RepID=A0A2I0K013_PUNGR|nr:hypothetical protein CRG98_017706 [Punica granatum]